MWHALLVDGKVVNVLTDEDFAQLIGAKLGSDVERYFRESYLDSTTDSKEIDCTGECDVTYGLQEHYENVLHSIKERLTEILKRKDTNYSTIVKLNIIINMINSEL